jgi:hypothetical protein
MADQTRQAERKPGPGPAQGCSAPNPFLGLGVAGVLVALALLAVRWLGAR